MAITHWWLGHNTETSATVVVRCGGSQIVAVAAGGSSADAVCVTGSPTDGIAVATLTGLLPGTSYPYTLNGVASGTLQTKSQSSEVWVAMSSCWGKGETDTLALKILRDHNIECTFCLGDFPYMNGGVTLRGFTTVPIQSGTLANIKSFEERANHFRQQYSLPGATDLMRRKPWYVQTDDHEYDPNNACPASLEWMQSASAAGIILGSPTITETDRAEYAASAEAVWRAYAQGNPSPGSPGKTWFSVRVGSAEFFCTDQIVHRSFYNAVDGPDKTMLGAEQAEWLLDAMASSSATFKIWSSTKQFVSTAGQNNDGYWPYVGGGSGYYHELGAMLRDARFPRAACMSVTGDEHLIGDIFIEQNYFGAGSAPISQISAGPATIPANVTPDDGFSYSDGVTYKSRCFSPPANNQMGENTYVLLKITPERVERYFLSSRYGLRKAGYIGTTDNAVRR